MYSSRFVNNMLYGENGKMKLFSIYTDQTTVLKNEWFLKTLKDDWELNILYLEDAPKGSGDYLSEEWFYCIKIKIEILIDAIKNNFNDIIIWADIDIQFFRECTDIVEQNIQGKDIVFQLWDKKKEEINSGFMAIRCNEKTLALFETVLKTPFSGRAFADQDVINDILKQDLIPLQWGFFPRDIYHVMLGIAPVNIALHHACATPEPFILNGRKVSSIDLKIEQLTAIRRFTASSLWGRIFIMLGKLLRRIIKLITPPN